MSVVPNRESMLCSQIIQECSTIKRDLYNMINFARELPALSDQLIPVLDEAYAAIDKLQMVSASIGSR